MEKELQGVLALLNQMSATIDTKLQAIDERLAKLEKIDSVEHRVIVNQIDITDIKDILFRLEGQPTEKLSEVINEAINRIEGVYRQHLQEVNKRLDSQLLKIAKTEEEILMLKVSQAPS
ncbi:hypothetical protein J27TS8_10510 [Robertmurraya siralis]|uniref:Uncharacterized protein n=1 Tax=Robertmurraya siralis TaxID=77777 RepID=A0A919WFX2_9BACI|nr:hypothetical protein [Robertmurraya siralis]PAE22538.1 hypothetical protein CHH80_00825 [Bacillus sp. 7504-2]GIN61058.1 hypothetical protein J27TS8_10510 [Robertmurraya siralis]